MPRAWNLTRTDIHYRHNAFTSGLRALGYDVHTGSPADLKAGDIVLGWNRYEPNHSIATKTEKAGGIYLCAENGYLGPAGVSPHGMKHREWYALARGFHNDSSVIRPDPGSRMRALQVELRPWRRHGTHILVCPNRTFGTPGRAMPSDWTSSTRRQLTALQRREIRIRPHPGNDQARTPLADDLRNAWAVVIWNSSAGVQALVAGVPVISCAPNWICKPAALTLDEDGIAQLETIAGDHVAADNARREALDAMACSQWHVDEIASGEAFRWVLG